MKVTDVEFIDFTTSQKLYEIIRRGAPAGYIDGYTMMDYGGGVFTDLGRCKQANHSVQYVGYGTENGIGYWIIKNSWSMFFGERGYMRLMDNGGIPCKGVWFLLPKVSPLN